MSFNIAMFPNDDKIEGTQAPDFKGWNKETGENIAAWWKVAKNGTQYLSVKVETKEDRQRGQQQVRQAMERPAGHAAQRQPPSARQQQPPPANDFIDDDIPW